jgi:RHS repeat-associated protein
VKTSSFGFNGMESDNEITGSFGNTYTTMFRSYDSRIGRWWSIDPEANKFPNKSVYIGYSNNPIIFVDPGGDADFYFNGIWIGTDGESDKMHVVITNKEIYRSIIKQTSKGKDYKELVGISNGFSDDYVAFHESVLVQAKDVLSMALEEGKKPVDENREFLRTLEYSDDSKQFELINDRVGVDGGFSVDAEDLKGSITIHSHPTAVNYKTGKHYATDKPTGSNVPGSLSGDTDVFRKFDMNIIVGVVGSPVWKYKEATTKTGSLEKTKYIDWSNRYSGMSIYDNSGSTKPKINISQTFLDDMIKGERGKNGEKFDKKKLRN